MSFLVSLFRPLAYLSLPAFALRYLASQSPAVHYFMRVGMYAGTLALVGTVGFIGSIGMSLAGQKYNVNWFVARTFYATASRVMGLEVQVEGEEHLSTRPAVFVGNHQSMVDILILGRVFPKQASIMAKKEIQWSPVLGPFMTMSGTVFIDRGNSASAHRSLEAAGEAIKARSTSLFIYPEGTRHSQEVPDLLPFKKGAFHLAVQSGLPIVPVVTENYWRLYRKGVFDEGTIRVRVLPPVSTAGLTTEDIPALTVRIRDLMLEALRDISVKVQLPAKVAAAASTVQDKPPVPAPVVLEEPARDTPTPAPSSPAISSSADSYSRRFEGSENGAETEEDEGMVLVGRPRTS